MMKENNIGCVRSLVVGFGLGEEREIKGRKRCPMLLRHNQKRPFSFNQSLTNAYTRRYKKKTIEITHLEQLLVFEGFLPAFVVAVHRVDHDVVHSLEVRELGVQSPVHQPVLEHFRCCTSNSNRDRNSVDISKVSTHRNRPNGMETLTARVASHT